MPGAKEGWEVKNRDGGAGGGVDGSDVEDGRGVFLDERVEGGAEVFDAGGLWGGEDVACEDEDAEAGVGWEEGGEMAGAGGGLVEDFVGGETGAEGDVLGVGGGSRGGVGVAVGGGGGEDAGGVGDADAGEEGVQVFADELEVWGGSGVGFDSISWNRIRRGFIDVAGVEAGNFSVCV